MAGRPKRVIYPAGAQAASAERLAAAALKTAAAAELGGGKFREGNRRAAQRPLSRDCCGEAQNRHGAVSAAKRRGA